MDDVKSSEWIPIPSMSRRDQEEVLRANATTLQDLLNLEQLYAHLHQANLLTPTEQEELSSLNRDYNRQQKIEKFVKSLPGKRSNALQHFVECLRNTTEGTAHDELAQSLQSTIQDSIAKRKESQSEGLSRAIPFQKSVVIAIIVGFIFILVLFFYGGGYFQSLCFTVLYNFNLHHSKSLPYRSEMFIGRETEIDELLQFVNFTNRHVRIVNIIGSPGFGKSTLAIHIGHRMVEDGVKVHYINMAEFPDKNVGQVLCEKVLESAEISTTDISISRLMKWAGDRYWYNLLILDNCDDSLHHQKEEFQKVVEDIIQYSTNVKILLTSRKPTMILEWFKEYKLYELSTKAACNLLDLKVYGCLKLSEREEIAELTGKVPLALQIIGSLLTLHDPPTPTEIIDDLRQQPIETLSPQKLPISKQLNASFSLSYNYLGLELQKIGRYLANFPGSFDREAACDVLRSVANNTSVTESDIVNSLRALVDRSLLEHSTRTDRYNFHRLIREFFIHIQSANRGMEERRHFLVNFQWFFANKLYSMTIDFVGYDQEYRKALHILDVERHNIQYFLSITGDQRYKDYTYSHDAVTAFQLALKSKYLTCRFSTEELLEPVRGVAHILKLQLVTQLRSIPNAISNFKPLVSFVIELSVLVQERQGTVAAVNELNSYVQLIDHISSSYTGIEISKAYTDFYVTLLQLYSEIDNETAIKECRTKILQKANQLQFCTPETCDYRDIGEAYYFTQDYENCARHIELALKTNNNVMQKASMNVYLWLSYRNLKKIKEQEAAVLRLVQLLPELLNQSYSVLFMNNGRLIDVVYILRISLHDEDATRLEQKQLRVLRDVGKRGDMDTVKKLYKFAQSLCNHKNYTECIDTAEFALDSFEDLLREEEGCRCVLQEKLNLELLLGKARYDSGNISASIEAFKTVINLLVKLNLVNDYKDDFKTSCSYLPLWYRKADCFDIINQISKYGVLAISGLFALPLEIDLDEKGIQELKECELSNPLYPKLSDSKEVVQVPANLEQYLNSIPFNTGFYAGQYLVQYSMEYFTYIVKFQPLRYVINTVSIIVRLYALYYFVIFLSHFISFLCHMQDAALLYTSLLCGRTESYFYMYLGVLNFCFAVLHFIAAYWRLLNIFISLCMFCSTLLCTYVITVYIACDMMYSC